MTEDRRRLTGLRSAVFRLACSQVYQVRAHNVGQAAQGLQGFFGNRFVYMNQRDGHAAHLLASELKPCDVDPFFPQQGPDGPDHAGNVPVMEHENIALGHGFEIEVVDLDDARVVATEYRSFDLNLLFPSLGAHRDGAGEVGGPAAFRLNDLDAALARYDRGVDIVDAGLHDRR